MTAGSTAEPRSGVPEDARATFFRTAQSFSPVVAAVADRATFLVPTNDTTVGLTLFVKGSRSEMRTLPRAIEALSELGVADEHRDTFVDIGANVGTTCITALKSYGFFAALACEPEPFNYRLLELNSILNGVDDRLQILPVAVADVNGETELIVNPGNSGGHQILHGSGGTGAPKRRHTVTVEMITLDHLVDQSILDPSRVGLVWVDVQGAESHVLKGATSLVTNGAPFVLEFHPELLQRGLGRVVLEDLIVQNYTHFIDLRRPRQNAASMLTKASGIHDFASKLSEASEYADILVVRRPRSKRSSGPLRAGTPGR
jgi:FkbM family methyltransferase